MTSVLSGGFIAGQVLSSKIYASKIKRDLSAKIRAIPLTQGALFAKKPVSEKGCSENGYR
jgi:hypothetical protein